MIVYLLKQFFVKYAVLFLVDQLQQNIVVIPGQTNPMISSLHFNDQFILLTYIHIATIDIGKAERPVNRRQPYVGTTNIAVTYSKMLPNDQNTSIIITIAARLVDGKYSNINVGLKKYEINEKKIFLKILYKPLCCSR